MSDDKVIQAFPTSADLPENPLQIAAKPPGVPYFCGHESIRLDPHERQVHCARCGATLDPFNFLMDQARVLQMAWQNHQHTRQQLGELIDRVTHLKKEEQNLKARVKRLQEKIPTVTLKPRDKN